VPTLFPALWLLLLVEPRWIPSRSMVPTLLPGDRVLVGRTAEREPRRFAVVTYRDAAGLTFVGRVVGLPGERLRIRHGDVFADDVLLRKPDDLRRAFRRPFARFGEFTDEGAPEEWVADDLEGDPAWRFRAPLAFDPPSDGLRDLYLEAESPPDAKAGLALEIRGARYLPGTLAFALRRDPRGETTLRARVAGGWADLAATPSVASAAPVPLSLSHVDGVLRARVGDWRFETEVEAAPGGAAPWVLGRVDRLSIDGDLHYTSQGDLAVEGDFAIEEGRVFVLADHSAEGRDSRLRAVGPVPLDRLGGRVLARFWPPARIGPVR
jgi:hypothetical protein